MTLASLAGTRVLECICCEPPVENPRSATILVKRIFGKSSFSWRTRVYSLQKHNFVLVFVFFVK